MLGDLPADWKKYHSDNLAKIDTAIRDRAVEFLRNFFTEEVKQLIREAEKDNPQTWWAAYHSFWGMGVRNTLRKNGFSEKELCVENLDDCYIGLVELAVL